MPEFKQEVLLVLCAEGEGPGRTEVRLVSWYDNAPVLEKRQFIRDRITGEERPGKCRGLSFHEIQKIVKSWPEIYAICKGKPLDVAT